MGLRRLALLGFAALLVLLFVVFAAAQGIGDPGVPSGDVVLIEDAPAGLGSISEEEFEHVIEVTAAQSQIKPIPKPGDEKYDPLLEAALGELFDTVWIQGQAEEMGITVTLKEVEDELEKLKTQAFKTEKRYEAFLKESHYTQKDVDQRVKVQIFSTKIQDQLKEEAPTPSSREIEEYYEEAKAAQYTTPESRDIRIVVNKDKAKVEEAKAQLEKDSSVQSWDEVAKKYSTDTTKNSGGLQPGVLEGQFPELNAAVFAAPESELEGPLEESRGYVVFEVVKVTSAKVSSLEEVESLIIRLLSERLQGESVADFQRIFNTTWASRTFCAPEVVMARCANFKGDGHPEGAPPACYEADPEEPAEECPAPVTQVKPALPGSVTALEPGGRKLAQRPHPAGDESSAEASPEALELIE